MSNENEEELSLKHQKFVDEYLIHFNATRAYQAAYPKTTQNSARVLGSALMANEKIRAAIKDRMEELAMSADEVLLRLADYARGNFRPFVKIEKGQIYFDLSSPEAVEHLHLVKRIDEIRVKLPDTPKEKKGKPNPQPADRWYSVELHDPVRALELLGKAHKLFVSRHELTGKDGAPLLPKSEPDFEVLAKYMSDEELEILQKAAEILEHAQREYEADQPPKPSKAPYIGRRSKPSDYSPGKKP